MKFSGQALLKLFTLSFLKKLARATRVPSVSCHVIDHFHLALTIRRPDEATQTKKPLPVHRFTVTELQESMVAVIGAHATITYAGQGQVITGRVLSTVIDSDTTRRGALAQCLYLALILAEVIECQGSRLVVNELNNLVERLVGLYRQHGAEYFILHNEGIIIWFDGHHKG